MPEEYEETGFLPSLQADLTEHPGLGFAIGALQTSQDPHVPTRRKVAGKRGIQQNAHATGQPSPFVPGIVSEDPDLPARCTH